MLCLQKDSTKAHPGRSMEPLQRMHLGAWQQAQQGLGVLAGPALRAAQAAGAPELAQ